MIPTLVIRGWRFHLLSRRADEDECPRFETHRTVESLPVFAARLKNALRGDALYVSILRRILSDQGTALGTMQMSDTELIEEIYKQLRTGRMVAVECEVVEPADENEDVTRDVPRTTVPMEGVQIHLLFGDDIPNFCPYHSGHVPFRFPEPIQRDRFVEALARRPDMVVKVRELLGAKLGGGAVWNLTGEDLMKKVVSLVQAGELSALRCRGSAGAGIDGGGAQDAAAGAGAGKTGSGKDTKDGGDKKKDVKDPAPPTPVKTWIAIQLVDEEGNPAPYERYSIKLTDGTTQEGRLDGNGSAKFTNIDPGTCEITFPDFDAKEWKAA